MNNSEDDNGSIEEENDNLTSVGDEQTRKKSGTGLLVKIVFFLILMALLGMGFVFVNSIIDSKDESNDHERPSLTEKPSSNSLPTRNFILPADPEPEITPIALRERTLEPMTEGVQQIEQKVTLDKSKSKLSAIRISKDAAKANGRSGSVRPVDSGTSGSELSQSLAPTVVSNASAAKLKNRNFILAKGAFINCVLKTKLDSSVAGMSSCIVTRDIYSDNGKVVLVEKGSEVTGEYRSKLNRGVSRIFVLWNRIKTPLGVVINIDSPATDSLGGSGLSGFLDTHFWQRFGGALLLSLIDDIAANIAANSNDGTIINSTSDSSNSGGEIALENSIDIPPTLHINHGAKVGIYVARDLDFSSVYYVK